MPDEARSHIVTVTRHSGPVLACCPVDCLKLVIRGTAFNILARAYDAPFDPPQTAGDVAGLHEQGRLGEIRGLGPILLARITAGLAEAGLISQGTGADMAGDGDKAPAALAGVTQVAPLRPGEGPGNRRQMDPPDTGG